MILVKGRKALVNPTRLRVLELLENPAAFDGPRGEERIRQLRQTIIDRLLPAA